MRQLLISVLHFVRLFFIKQIKFSHTGVFSSMTCLRSQHSISIRFKTLSKSLKILFFFNISPEPLLVYFGSMAFIYQLFFQNNFFLKFTYTVFIGIFFFIFAILCLRIFMACSVLYNIAMTHGVPLPSQLQLRGDVHPDPLLGLDPRLAVRVQLQLIDLL